MIDDSSVSLLLKNGTAVGSAQQIYCLSWNYHELDNPHSVQALHKMVRVKRPLFIFLIETFYLYKKNRSEFYSVDCVGHQGGFALLWKFAKRVDLISFSARYIDTKVEVDSVGTWRLTGFYGEPNWSRRVFS